MKYIEYLMIFSGIKFLFKGNPFSSGLGYHNHPVEGKYYRLIGLIYLLPMPITLMVLIVFFSFFNGANLLSLGILEFLITIGCLVAGQKIYSNKSIVDSGPIRFVRENGAQFDHSRMVNSEAVEIPKQVSNKEKASKKIKQTIQNQLIDGEELLNFFAVVQSIGTIDIFHNEQFYIGHVERQLVVVRLDSLRNPATVTIVDFDAIQELKINIGIFSIMLYISLSNGETKKMRVNNIYKQELKNIKIAFKQ